MVEPAEAISGISQFNITSPKEKAADYTKISEYVGAVYGLTADEVVAVNPTDADLESFGLKEPYSKIVADFDVGTVTLLGFLPGCGGKCVRDERRQNQCGLSYRSGNADLA